MPRDLTRLEPPGEDTFDLPESLGWFVATCTWVRHMILALGEPPRGRASRARPRGLTETEARLA